MFSVSGNREPGTGRQLIRVSRGGYRHGPRDTYISREVSHLPLPTKPLTWWGFALLCLAPFIVPIIGLLIALP